MKKIIFIFTSLLFTSNCFADEFTLQIQPKTLTANTTLIDSEGTVNHTNSIDLYLFEGSTFVAGDIQAIQVSIYLPEGINPFGSYTYFDEDEEEYVTAEKCEIVNGHRTYAAGSKGRTYKLIKSSSSSIPGYNKYLVSAYADPGNKIVKKTSLTNAVDEFGGGIVASIYVDTREIAEGVYPVYQEEVVIGENASKGYYIDARTTSYIKVGAPKDAKVTLEGEVASCVNRALADDASITSVDLSKVTISNGTFTYVDARDVKAPTATVKSNVAFKRAAGSSTYASLCLPFEAEVNCYTLESAADGTAHFNAATTAPAGKSVLVDGKTAIDVTASDVEIAAVAGKPITSGFYVKGDKLYSVNGTAKVPACKGYWTEGAGSNMRIVIDGVTGIEEATIDANETTFDLQGRRVVNANNGLYIVNGKKQIVK